MSATTITFDDRLAAKSTASVNTRASSLWRDRRAIIGATILLILLVSALAGPALRQLDPNRLDLASAGAPPSVGHPLGTDESGRDVLARIFAGGRVSLAVGFAAMFVSVGLGTILGSLAGMKGGWIDSFLMRLTDAVLSIPTIFVVICVLTFLGPSIPTLVIAIGTTSWMSLARLVRGELLSIRELPFAEAATALGERPLQLFVRHLLPHLWPAVLVNATIGVGTAILTESALSFLGLGVQPPAASWGNMLSGAQSYLFTYPWLAIYPGAMIMLTVVAINLLGDAFADRWHPTS
ncbi:MAG: ABC transporter permease [Gemmatimonadaceae bacterium]